MKAFERVRGIARPLQVKMMLDYLEVIGKVNAAPEQIEVAYTVFCEEVFDSFWMKPTEEILGMFSEFLEEYEV